MEHSRTDIDGQRLRTRECVRHVSPTSKLGSPRYGLRNACQGTRVILTASLTTGVARVADGFTESVALIDEILATEHTSWETTLNVGDFAFYESRIDGPFPNHQFRISVSPSAGFAAC